MGALYIFFLFDDDPRSNDNIPSPSLFTYKNVIYPDVLEQTLKIPGTIFQALEFNQTRFLIGCYTTSNQTRMSVGLTLSAITQGIL